MMMQSFVSMGVASIVWFAVGFSLCFGDSVYFIGNPWTDTLVMLLADPLDDSYFKLVACGGCSLATTNHQPPNSAWFLKPSHGRFLGRGYFIIAKMFANQ